MTEPTTRTVENMKHDHPFAAGALAYSLGMSSAYGCHYGMRSTVEHCRRQFRLGWDAAQHASSL
jgi:hypothetical protein